MKSVHEIIKDFKTRGIVSIDLVNFRKDPDNIFKHQFLFQIGFENGDIQFLPVSIAPFKLFHLFELGNEAKLL